MSRFASATAQPVDYFILVEPRADGPVVGYYGNHPISAAVVDYFGRHYTYAGVIARRRSGQYDVESLRPGEWIIEPGLVYTGPDGRASRSKQPFWRKRLTSSIGLPR
jgi:hypothetical protein